MALDNRPLTFDEWNVRRNQTIFVSATPADWEIEQTGGEVVEQLSLGAGNSGKSFDLTTNQRVAEFKFIQWRGGAESARKRELFKDFYWLAEAATLKRKYLYVVGLEHPLKFLKSGEAISSVMNRSSKGIAADFQERYGERFVKVRDYYAYRQGSVELVDLKAIAPYFRGNLTVPDDADSSE